MKKRILLLLIVLCLVVGMVPTVSALELDNGLEYTVYEDHVKITGYTGDATEVVIPAQIEGLPVTVIGSWAFSDCSHLISISIPDSITGIDYFAFSGCSSLTSISIPNSVTHIGDHAFDSCSALTDITISDSITSIGSEVFSWCSSLTDISIPNSVTDIGSGAFNGCSSLTNITIPDSVISIGSSAFAECSNLTTISIPDGIVEIGSSSFYNCSSLSSISIPDSVTQICGGAFFGCSALTNITIPDGVNDIGNSTFAHCYNLTNITIPDGVTYIGDSTFENCTSLTSISIPDSVMRINRFAFNGCTNLISISIPDNVTDIGVAAFQGCGSLTSISIPARAIRIDSSAFNDCSSLTEILVDKNNPNYSSDDCGVFFNKDKSELIRAPGAINGAYTIPNNVTHIGDSAFSFCTNLTSVSIPGSVTRISGFAFLLCTNLNSIRFLGDAPNMDNGAYSIFANVTATAYYPSNNPTWTEDILQNYGGTITWVPYNPDSPFTDVPAGSFYEAPVLWALENNITTGATETTFNPNGQCLRAHVVTFLHRAAENPEPTSTKNPFTDVKTSDFFYKPVLWAVEKGITNGVSATEFGSYAVCNRAAVVTFLWRAAGSPEPESSANPFTDVKTTDFFYKPVLWAVENGITNGISATQFGPGSPCNRAQVVTFLYRAYN